MKASPEEHMQRLRGQGDERPMAGHPKAMEEPNPILKSRGALYKQAEATVNTSDKSPPECRVELVRAVREPGVA